MVSLDERLYDYQWSSYRRYVSKAGRPGWFERDWVLAELQLDDDAAGRRLYAERMRERGVAELTAAESPALAELRRGWCLGSAGFRERMLGLLEMTGGKLRRGREVRCLGAAQPWGG